MALLCTVCGDPTDSPDICDACYARIIGETYEDTEWPDTTDVAIDADELARELNEYDRERTKQG